MEGIRDNVGPLTQTPGGPAGDHHVPQLVSVPPADIVMSVDSVQYAEPQHGASPGHREVSQLTPGQCWGPANNRQEGRNVPVTSASVLPAAPTFRDDQARRQIGHPDSLHTTSPRHLNFGPSGSDNHAKDIDPGKPHAWIGGGEGSSHYVASHHLRHHGEKVRSDAYLRQALTSPYNQRAKQFTSSPSPSRLAYRNECRSMLAGSSPVRHAESPSKGGAVYEKREGTVGSPKLLPHNSGHGDHHHGHGEGAPDSHVIFKTPHRMSPRKDRHHPPPLNNAAGWMSPVSSASVESSSSSGSRHPHHNPFESGHDHLHGHVFSPGLFHVSGTPVSTNGSFRWDPEHLAELRPVHIDEKDIKRQFRKSPDNELEERAQRAIDYYFSNHMVAPSPWGQDPPPHVLPVTPAYDKGYMSTPSETHGSIQKVLRCNKKGKDASCQTALTLPVDFDIQKVLGEYMTYQDPDEGNTENMSTSSLRRKLFFNADSSSLFSPVKTGKESPDHVSQALLSPPPFTPSRKTTPEWERGSPTHTPSSVQFSSSPIRGPYCTDGEYLRCSFSDHGGLASPELSPITHKQKDKPHPVRRFSSMESDDGGEHLDDVDIAFGTGVRQRLQMDMHDGPPSPPGRPSPNMSPIAFSGNDTTQTSRSRTLRADSSSMKNESSERDGSAAATSQLPLPFTSCGSGGLPTSNSVFASMDTDPFTASDNHDRSRHSASPREVSMTDVGEGGSGLDTLQHPHSLSNQDTGYQTASGSGSLQTTHDGALQMTQQDVCYSSGGGIYPHEPLQQAAGAHEDLCLMPASSNALNSSNHSTSAETKQHVRNAEFGTPISLGVKRSVHFTALNNSGIAQPDFQSDSVPADLPNGTQSVTQADTKAPFRNGGSAGNEDTQQSVSDMYLNQDTENTSHFTENGAPHTNLTDRFLGMPFQAEISVEGTDLEFESSMHGEEGPVVQSAFQSQKARPGQPYNSQQTAKDEHHRIFNSTELSEISEGYFPKDRQDNLFRNSGEKLSSPRMPSCCGLTDEDLKFLTEDEKLYNQDPKFIAKVAEYLERETPDSDAEHKLSALQPEAEDRGKLHDRKMAVDSVNSQVDDTVLERAKRYLSSVANQQSSSGSAGGLSFTPTSRSLALPFFTPSKKMLRDVAEDLAASRDGSPALASEVAKEILRRAEEDLHSVEKLRSADTSCASHSSQ